MDILHLAAPCRNVPVTFTLDRMYEVHLFQAIATAHAVASGSYMPGARHAMLAFVRQAPATDHDWEIAETGIEQAGWREISFQRAGTLNPENLNGKSDDFRGAFEHAMNGGCGLIVYSDPVTNDDEE